MAKKTTSDLPTKVKIGYRDYKIVEWPHMQAAASGRFGEMDSLNRVIKVDMVHGLREAAATLLHEILHAAWRMSEMREREHAKEEEVVSVMTAQFSAAWRDNPEVFAWIGHHLVHGT